MEPGWKSLAGATRDDNDVLQNREDLTSSTTDDFLTGTSGPNVVDGNGGTDFCVGNGGADSFVRCEASLDRTDELAAAWAPRRARVRRPGDSCERQVDGCARFGVAP